MARIEEIDSNSLRWMGFRLKYGKGRLRLISHPIEFTPLFVGRKPMLLPTSHFLHMSILINAQERTCPVLAVSAISGTECIIEWSMLQHRSYSRMTCLESHQETRLPLFARVRRPLRYRLLPKLMRKARPSFSHHSKCLIKIFFRNF